jgi:hypothetical protein
MRKVCSVVCHVVAGFFIYMLSVLAFVSGFPAFGKTLMLAGFSVPAIIALAIGLAFTGFRRWKRDAGLVLLWTSGFNAFVVLTMTCLLMSEEFRKLIPVDVSARFDSYIVGGLVVIGIAVAGWLLLKADDKPAVAQQ